MPKHTDEYHLYKLKTLDTFTSLAHFSKKLVLLIIFKELDFNIQHNTLLIN